MIEDFRMIRTARIGSGSSREQNSAPAGSPAREVRRSLRCGSARRLFHGALWGLGISASILAAYGLSCALVRSPLFEVELVEVETSGKPCREEILSMSGIRPGMNLISLNAADVSRRLEAHPWIRNATVVKRMPNRVVIKAHNRRPAVVLEIRGGLFYMDEEGSLLDRIRPGEPLDLPLLTGLEQRLGEAPPCGDGRDVQQALALLRAVQATPALGSLSEIHVDRSMGLSFFLEGFPLPVQVGWAGFPEKMSRFAKVLPLLALQSGSIERVDLRFSDQIVVRYGAGGKPRVPERERTEAWAKPEASLHTT